MADSVLFTYGAPFVGVLLVAVGIAAAVPGAFALLQDDATCGNPTIAVEDPAQTEAFRGDPPASIARYDIEALSAAEREAVEAAIADAVGEAEVEGAFPNEHTFRQGVLVTVDDQQYYVTLVAENPCYTVGPLQLPLGVFAIALGIVGILTPPAYRRLVALEESLLEP